MLIRIIRQWDDTVEHDAAVGDGTGLIKVQAVHTGKRLHGLEFLHQRVPSCQSDCGKREIQRGEQHQAFGNHAHHTGHGGDDRGTPLAGRNGSVPASHGVNLRPDEQHA